MGSVAGHLPSFLATFFVLFLHLKQTKNNHDHKKQSNNHVLKGISRIAIWLVSRARKRIEHSVDATKDVFTDLVHSLL